MPLYSRLPHVFVIISIKVFADSPIVLDEQNIADETFLTLGVLNLSRGKVNDADSLSQGVHWVGV